YPMVVATAPNSPLQSFGDLIARTKAAPFDVTYGMNLPGSVHHLTGELINVEAGTSLRGIPYRGNTQIVQDLLGGRLDVMIETGTIAVAQINGGMVRGLAVSSRKRFMLAPDIPTIAETLPGLEVMSWLGLAAPGGTPRPIIDRLNWEVGEILKLQDIRDKLAIVGNIPMPSTPKQMQDYIERDAARWRRVLDSKGIGKYGAVGTPHPIDVRHCECMWERPNFARAFSAFAGSVRTVIASAPSSRSALVMTSVWRCSQLKPAPSAASITRSSNTRRAPSRRSISTARSSSPAPPPAATSTRSRPTGPPSARLRAAAGRGRPPPPSDRAAC